MTLKNRIFKCFKFPIIFLLKTIKKFRHFDKSFRVYFPDISNDREISLWKLMVLNPLLNIDVNFKKHVSSKVPIDIYIPISVKDLKSLNAVIENARINVKHP